MMKLLEVLSSVRQQGSISRQLSADFIQVWRSRKQQREYYVGIWLTEPLLTAETKTPLEHSSIGKFII